MKLRLLLTIVFFTNIILFTSAQVSDDKNPKSWDLGISFEQETEIMPFVDEAKLIREDSLALIEEFKKPYKFGENIDVSFNLFNSGKWTELKNGDRIWTLNIYSAGARSLNFLMNRYSLPEGGELYIYSDDRSSKIGPYTFKENQDDGVLGTWVVHGDNVWLEYYEPKDVKNLGRISISEVVHGYKPFADPTIKYQKALNDSGACNVDVMCDPNLGSTNGVDWTNVRDNYRHAVGVIIVGGSTSCTGTLVNNVREDGTPYFLTANHCLGNVPDGFGSNYPSNNWAVGFDWFTNTPDCATFSNTQGPTFSSRIVSGMTLRANRYASDVALFELNQTPPSSWNLYYAGWNNSPVPSSSQLGMHHPSGDIMKLSRYDRTVSSITVSGIQCWRVANWDYGVTEGGSSGSCLIDPQGRIVGQLLGGGAACSGINDNNQEDWYGKMSVSWSSGFNSARRLREWLDPDNSGATTLDGSFENTLGVDDVESPFQISLFPNPTSGIINLETDRNAKYSVLTLSGKMIKSSEVVAGSNTINLSQYASGIYFIKVTAENATTVLKVVKE
ncbi:lysyl endopeptidase precursor [Nonlabens spongiae]|uniref:Lysyl endopeptidase n=1 Tax=Nonlabens spongiae TaxID=331648 RepID=A0A1W6MMG8_9FLAO|nr:T9SS type A sorting domain-containing protein [Nonlabens spongiae]ARN78716.1 lysyl endopeptidase precursor [Nonlabens spongiae]